MLEPDIMEKTPTPSTDGMMARNSSTEPEVVEGLIGYKCNVDGCGKRFPTAHGLRNHHVQVHARPEDRPFLCSFAGCIRRYSRVKDLQKHIREKHHSHQCQVTGCGISFATAQALTVHEVEAHTLWRCTSKTCSFVCGSGDEMSTHRRGVHKNRDSMEFYTRKSSSLPISSSHLPETKPLTSSQPSQDPLNDLMSSSPLPPNTQPYPSQDSLSHSPHSTASFHLRQEPSASKAGVHTHYDPADALPKQWECPAAGCHFRHRARWGVDQHWMVIHQAVPNPRSLPDPLMSQQEWQNEGEQSDVNTPSRFNSSHLYRSISSPQSSSFSHHISHSSKRVHFKDISSPSHKGSRNPTKEAVPASRSRTIEKPLHPRRPSMSDRVPNNQASSHRHVSAPMKNKVPSARAISNMALFELQEGEQELLPTPRPPRQLSSSPEPSITSSGPPSPVRTPKRRKSVSSAISDPCYNPDDSDSDMSSPEHLAVPRVSIVLPGAGGPIRNTLPDLDSLMHFPVRTPAVLPANDVKKLTRTNATSITTSLRNQRKIDELTRRDEALARAEEVENADLKRREKYRLKRFPNGVGGIVLDFHHSTETAPMSFVERDRVEEAKKAEAEKKKRRVSVASVASSASGLFVRERTASAELGEDTNGADVEGGDVKGELGPGAGVKRKRATTRAPADPNKPKRAYVWRDGGKRANEPGVIKRIQERKDNDRKGGGAGGMAGGMVSA